MRQPPLSAVRCCAQQQHPPPAVMVQMWGLLLFLAARVVHAVQTPYLTLQDNLGEPSNLGFCIDLKGWPGQFTDAQLHSCKPTGGSAGGGSDQQFVPQGGAVVGRADAVGHCLQAQTASAGSHLDVPACDSTEPLQRFIWASGQLQLQNTGLCLAASTRSWDVWLVRGPQPLAPAVCNHRHNADNMASCKWVVQWGGASSYWVTHMLDFCRAHSSKRPSDHRVLCRTVHRGTAYRVRRRVQCCALAVPCCMHSWVFILYANG
jgi:hypothetical protein